MLWEVDIYPAPGQPDRNASAVAGAAADLGLAEGLRVAAASGYLIQGPLDERQVARIARELLVDSVVERAVIDRAGQHQLVDPVVAGVNGHGGHWQIVHVLPKPGVMDPVAQSALAAIADLDLKAEAVRTFRKYWLNGLSDEQLKLLCAKVLANDAIE
ncbi:MAG: phosphoribosylformylglycinamidine synthase subunit PurS, partial [Pirellulales bacterium]